MSNQLNKKSLQTSAIADPNPNALSFSLKEATVVTGVTLWAIRKAIWGRKLPAHLVGKRQIVLRVDLERWLEGTPIAHARRAETQKIARVCLGPKLGGDLRQRRRNDE